MYSVVLMAALTTAPSAQSWHRGGCHGCHSCHGCYATRGYVAAACTCSYGCYGSGCYGCYGCYGSPWYGASYTSGSYGCAVGVVPVYQCHGCYGCYGGWSCYGYPTHHAVTESAPPSTTVPEKKPATKPGKIEETPPPLERKKTEEQARARVIVDVPADAKLFVDGQLINTTSARRIFQTPELIAGQTYYYELTAEVIRDGQTISASQRVILRPGQAATASFADLGRRSDATAQAGQQ